MIRTSIIIIAALFVIIIFISLSSVYGLEGYHPSISIYRIQKDPAPFQGVEIAAVVKDRYGQTRNPVLSYSLDQGESWNNRIVMRLIDGVPSNGTYLGIIPGQNENTSMIYKVYVNDNLNYSDVSTQEKYNVSRDITNPNMTSIGLPTQPTVGDPVKVTTKIWDDGSSVKNVTLYYSTNSIPKNNTIKMNQIGSGLRYIKENEINRSHRVFEGLIPAFGENTTVKFYLEGYDYAGNKGIDLGQYTVKRADQPAIHVTIKVLDLDIHNLKARAEINVVGHVHNRNYIPFIEGINSDKNGPEDRFVITLENRTSPFTENPGPFTSSLVHDITTYSSLLSDDALSSSDIFFSNTKNNTAIVKNLTLFGDPSRFPFDKYYLNLTFAIPFEDPRIEYDYEIATSPKISWNSSINPVEATTTPRSEFYNNFFPNAMNTKSYNPNSLGLMNFRLDFTRNYSISAIIVPLLAIFYLLGAIFILDSTSEQLGSRLAITLSIFAFVFTISPILDHIKPLTANIPTVADFLITTLIIATIAFSVGSVISCSSVIKNRYQSRKVWIDRSIFIFIAIVIIYTSFSNYPDISIWLVPVILFGLGYGLILNLFGIKINKPLKIRLHREEEKSG
jgi:hypothetical protein